MGLFVGMAANVGLGRLIRNQLYEVSPLDPMVIAAVLIAMGAWPFSRPCCRRGARPGWNPAEVLNGQ